MSAVDTQLDRGHLDAHGEDTRHVHGHDEHGEAHGSFKGYMIGFLLSVVLTAIPFWLVMGDVLPSKQLTTVLILGFALVQVLVHMVYFLHMNSKSDEGWNLTAFIFTVIIIAIVVVGSIWIMWNLNYNMMMH